MMSDNTERWRIEREKHPFFGEAIGKDRYDKVWDDAAERYEDAGVGRLKDEIIAKLFKSVIRNGDDVLDVGSGPGTYGIEFAERCRSVVCLDGSQNMLDRIVSKGIGNVRCIKSDWETFDTDERFDVVFSSLCPALNNPEGILKMESFSKRHCAYVSSMNDDTGTLRRDLWKEFGKDYTMNGYDTRYPYTFLKENGREPTLDIFETITPYEIGYEEAISKEIEYFSFYMDISEKRRFIIEDMVKRHTVSGKVRFEGRKRLGLLCWKLKL